MPPAVVKAQCISVSGLNPSSRTSTSTYDALDGHFGQFGRVLTIHWRMDEAKKKYTGSVVIVFDSQQAATAASSEQKQKLGKLNLHVTPCAKVPDVLV